jgi:uncharacterized SAM-binding protein YcdF (DUF218 family)
LLDQAIEVVLKSRIFRIVVVAVVVWMIGAALAPRALVVSAPLVSADAIVVLSGSSAYRERTEKAAELYRKGRAPLVLLTDDHMRGGWSSAQQRNPFFVERATDELLNAGVPADRIRIVPGVAASTRDEALIVKEFIVNERFQSVLVVTSSYHSRRALRTLQQVFAGTGTTIGLEPDTASVAAFWWLRPEGWRTVGVEFVKLIYYWFMYE